MPGKEIVFRTSLVNTYWDLDIKRALDTSTSHFVVLFVCLCIFHISHIISLITSKNKYQIKHCGDKVEGKK